MELIDKAAVVAEIQRRIDLLKSNQNPGGPIFCFARETIIEEYKNILSFLDTLEVKEVDFESEWKKYFEYRGDVATVNIKHLAKHFFELGLSLKAQKEGLKKKESEINCPNFDEAQGTPITK